MMELTLENIADFKDQAQASFYRDEITEQEYRILKSLADTIASMWPWVLTTSMTLSLLALILVVLALIGIINKRHKLIYPWIVATAIGIVLACLLVVTSSVLLSLAFPITFILMVIGVALPVILGELYCWWVVKSEFDNIKESSWMLPTTNISASTSPTTGRMKIDQKYKKSKPRVVKEVEGEEETVQQRPMRRPSTIPGSVYGHYYQPA